MRSTSGRVLVATAAVLVALAAALAAAPAPVAGAEARAADCITPEGEVAVGRVLVVVSFPSGVVSRCVPPGGSGIATLRSAQFTVTTSGFGTVGGAAAVCAIKDERSGEQVGCADGPSCLTCAAPDYWQYYRCWAYSPVGGASTSPAGGTIEGWRWARSSGWPAGLRPAACDSDGDDAATPVVTPPSSTPTRPGPDPTRPPAGGTRPGGGSGPSGPASPSGPGADPGDPAEPGRPDDGTTTSSTAPGADPGDDPGPGEEPAAGASGDDPDPDGAGSPSGPAGSGRQGDRTEAGGPVPPGSGSDGGGGGGGWLPLAGTAAVVAALGAGAVGMRRRRVATATSAAETASQG